MEDESGDGDGDEKEGWGVQGSREEVKHIGMSGL